MKLYEVAGEEFAPEEKITGKLSDGEMRIAYDRLLRSEMDMDEIQEFAQSVVERGDYARTADSAMFVLTRMHILLHGVAPEGLSQSRASTMFQPSNHLIQYVLSRGDLDREDLQLHMKAAEEEFKQRRVRVPKPQAVKMMAQEYKQGNYPSSIRQHRDEIIAGIMDGYPPAEVFAQFA